MQTGIVERTAGTVSNAYVEARRLWQDERGVATVEYAVLVSVIVVASAGAWAGLHTALVGLFTRTVASIGGSATP